MAYPYYASFSMMAGVFLFSCFHYKEDQRPKQNKRQKKDFTYFTIHARV